MKSSWVLAVAAVGLLAGCWSDDHMGPSTPHRAWVAIEPTQCLTNPWEQDWLAKHDNDYAGYPKDPLRPGLEPEEFAIIQAYYGELGVRVFDGRTVQNSGGVCTACSCPEGHTMYLQVRELDVETMTGLGYRVESP